MPRQLVFGLTLISLFACTAAFADAIPVRGNAFAQLAIFPKLSAPATVVSDNQSRISAEVQARIIEIPVRVGDKVKKGDLLARLDSQDFELVLIREGAALGALKARLDLAKYELKRARTLSKKQAVSEQLLKQRETERNALLADQQGRQAASGQAQRQLDKTEIRAPFNATVLERLASIGELANPGTPLFRIVDADNLELSVKLSSKQASTLHKTAASTNASSKLTPMFVSADQRFSVALRIITPALDTQARTQEARFRFTGNKKPLPGTTGKLVWAQAQASLPAELISQRQGKLGVFIQSDNKARFIELPQAQTGQPVVARLAADAVVITDGRFRLQNDDVIHVSKDSRTD